MTTDERFKRQVDDVRQAIDAVCQAQGHEAASDYMTSLLCGSVDYMLSFRSRREAYGVIQRIADEIIEQDLPK
jgi:hypothetical protein